MRLFLPDPTGEHRRVSYASRVWPNSWQGNWAFTLLHQSVLGWAPPGVTVSCQALECKLAGKVASGAQGQAFRSKSTQKLRRATCEKWKDPKGSGWALMSASQNHSSFLIFSLGGIFCWKAFSLSVISSVSISSIIKSVNNFAWITWPWMFRTVCKLNQF